MEISQNFVAFSEYTNFNMAVKICHPVEDPVNWSAKIWGVLCTMYIQVWCLETAAQWTVFLKSITSISCPLNTLENIMYKSRELNQIFFIISICYSLSDSLILITHQLIHNFTSRLFTFSTFFFSKIRGSNPRTWYRFSKEKYILY